MFRALNAHLQENTVVYMQHMVLSLSMRVRGGLTVHCQFMIHGQKNIKLCDAKEVKQVYHCVFLSLSMYSYC